MVRIHCHTAPRRYHWSFCKCLVHRCSRLVLEGRLGKSIRLNAASAAVGNSHQRSALGYGAQCCFACDWLCGQLLFVLQLHTAHSIFDRAPRHRGFVVYFRLSCKQFFACARKTNILVHIHAAATHLYYLLILGSRQLVGITIGMAVLIPPKPPYQTYTQAYWYAVIAAVLYFLCSIILLINLLGYFLGRYGQHFVLTYAQRTLILQTFLFFIWLAGGAGVYTAIEPWNFSNAVSLNNFPLVMPASLP